MGINNVIICGLGALGLTYANKLKNVCTLKILANPERIKRYQELGVFFNNEQMELEYLTPSDTFKADLIIISTKSTGLDSAIGYIKNFVSENTIIISLINGISSEEKILKAYPYAKVLRSYFIGHSAVRNSNKINQDGVGKIVFEPNNDLEKFFKTNKIDYETTPDIFYSQWLKLGVNIILNEPSAVYQCSVGELRKKKEFLPLAQNLLNEVQQIALACGIKNLENYTEEVIKSTDLIADNGKTSMYQDIIAKRKTEVEIFSGEIIKLGKTYGIKTPYNEYIYNKIKEIERDFQ